MITPKILLQNAEKYPSEAAFSLKNKNKEWKTDNWSDFRDYAFQIAKSLIKFGINTDDKISIYSYNRKEWFGAYAATQMVGGVSVGVYHTCSAEEVEWIVGNSCSKIVFIGHNPNDNDEKDKMPINRIIPVLNKLNDIEKVVLMDGVESVNHEKIITWQDFLSSGKDVKDSEIHSRIDRIKEDDTSALIYTSGTTGNPKGVALTHGNWKFQVESTGKILKFNQGERYVSWLPLAHVFGQLVDNHTWIKNALHMYVVDSPLNVVDYAKEVKPHLFIGVPRIYEKIYSNLKSAIDNKSILKVGLKIPFLSDLFKGKLKEAVGFSNTRYAATGAAPIYPEILKFFHNLDIPIYEGYGMTECSGLATMMPFERVKLGTTGLAVPFVELKISSEGEILLRGENVFMGYHNQPDKTAESIRDGWLRTGDIGFVDNEGFVKITDRMKDIIITAGGTNITPSEIENQLKFSPYISDAVVVGDQRKFLSCLIMIDEDNVVKFAQDHDVPFTNFASLTRSEDVIELIEKEVKGVNEKFARVESIKTFRLIEQQLDPEDEELTPTMKLKRQLVNVKYKNLIDDMYAAA